MASCDQEGLAENVRLRHKRTKRMAQPNGPVPNASNELNKTETHAMKRNLVVRQIKGVMA